MLKKLKVLLEHGNENRDTFFERINNTYVTLDTRYQLIEKAYNDGKDAFREKSREDGTRYFEHLRGVTLILMDHLFVRKHTIIIPALLHDIIEDCPEWPLYRVRAEYGDEVALLVEWLTMPPEKDGLSKKVRTHRYHDRFSLAPREFFLIKLSDRLHNLMHMWIYDGDKQRRKIEETRLYYLPWAKEHNILAHELEAAMEELEKKLSFSEEYVTTPPGS